MITGIIAFFLIISIISAFICALYAILMVFFEFLAKHDVIVLYAGFCGVGALLVAFLISTISQLL